MYLPDKTSGKDYPVVIDRQGNFVCPKFKKENLHLAEIPYNMVDNTQTAPRAICSSGQVFGYPKVQKINQLIDYIC